MAKTITYQDIKSVSRLALGCFEYLGKYFKKYFWLLSVRVVNAVFVNVFG